MTDKHTPGPWQIEPVGFSYYEILARGDSGLMTVMVADEVMRSPDARLIAAAPDLLAALEDIASAWGAEEVSDAIHASRAAIAKARGQV